MRWTKSVSLVAFVLVAVLIASGVTATVWARSGGGGAAPPISQPLAQIAQTGTIVIVKDAVPDDPQVFNFSGSGGLGPFSLDDDPNTPLPNTRTFPNLQPDLYTVTELFPITGWFLMNGSVCKFPDGSATTFGSQATFNLTAGATVTCTFTNYKAGRVIVDKTTIPAGDPTVFQFNSAWGNFSLTDTSPPHDSGPLPPIGSLQNGYMLTEIPVSGWTTSIACKDPDGGTTVGPTSANPTLAPTAVVIDLDAGETITCIFTNTKTVDSAPDLTIAKEAVVSQDGQTITYIIKVTNIGTMPAMNIRVDDVLIPLPSGSQFVSASGPGWSCVAPGSGPVNCTYAGILAPGGPPLTITIIVAVGSLGGDFDNCAMVSYPSTAAIPPDSNLLNNTSCVKTSVTRPDVKLGTIVIIKDAQPDNPQVFDFEGSLGPFSLDDDGVGGSLLPNTQTFASLPPGPYTVTEKGPPSGWVSSIACKDPDGGTTVAGNSANIDLDAGETVTCIFTNKKDVPPPPATTTYIYSVKIVCGTVTPPRPKPSIPTLRDPAPVVPGLYRTAVNIHNFWEKETTFLQKVAIALPQDQPRGPVTKKVQAKLGPNEALEVDCFNIVAIVATLEGTTSARAEFLKGFLVIESPVELEVTAVYTAEELQENGISIDVEQINPHIVKKETPRGLDLAVSKDQEGKFPIGGIGVYVIKVTANGVANPPIKVTDTLPFGFTFVPNSATPPWTCTVTTPANPPTDQEVVECSYPAALAANATLALMFKVNVNPIAAIPPGPNCAEVKHPQDTNPANDKSCREVILQASGSTPASGLTPAPASTPPPAGRPGG